MIIPCLIPSEWEIKSLDSAFLDFDLLTGLKIFFSSLAYFEKYQWRAEYVLTWTVPQAERHLRFVDRLLWRQPLLIIKRTMKEGSEDLLRYYLGSVSVSLWYKEGSHVFPYLDDGAIGRNRETRRNQIYFSRRISQQDKATASVWKKPSVFNSVSNDVTMSQKFSRYTNTQVASCVSEN